tara:strand:+ start:180 stop:893 length:714 start_codon:yes stop_codon:yes gene_type:complete
MIDYLNYGKQVDGERLLLNDVAKRTKRRVPDNLGWLECELSKDEIDHLWKCVSDSKEKNLECFKKGLAGNISHSYILNDIDGYFFKHTIKPLITLYQTNFCDLTSLNMGLLSEEVEKLEPVLDRFWVNYQKQHEFNPLHSHGGLYSFIIWLKIPVEFEDQNKDNITNNPLKSAFQFLYTNIIGIPCRATYELGKGFEGRILFFPSNLQHVVWPFYNCDEDRISISGNILMSIKNDAL